MSGKASEKGTNRTAAVRTTTTAHTQKKMFAINFLIAKINFRRVNTARVRVRDRE